jgi:hypothetical protein
MGTHFMDLGYEVYPTCSGGGRGPEHYANQKAEMYWGFRERLSAGRVIGLIDQESARPNLTGRPATPE